MLCQATRLFGTRLLGKRLLGRALVATLCLTACGSPTGSPPLPAEYRQLDIPWQRLDSAEARDRGARLFAVSCALCHGQAADGRGVRQRFSTPPQDFTSPVWQKSADPREVFFVIREGRRGTSMPPWKGAYDDEATWDLTAFLLSFGDRAEGPAS